MLDDKPVSSQQSVVVIFAEQAGNRGDMVGCAICPSGKVTCSGRLEYNPQNFTNFEDMP